MVPTEADGSLLRRDLMPLTAMMYRFLAPVLSAQFITADVCVHPCHVSHLAGISTTNPHEIRYISTTHVSSSHVHSATSKQYWETQLRQTDKTIRGLSTGPSKVSENFVSSGSTTAFRKGQGFVGTWSRLAFRLKHYTRPSFLTAIPASKSGLYLLLFVCDLNHIQRAANTRYNTTALL